MSIAILNQWLNDLMPRAEALAALDKIIKPLAVTPDEAEEIRKRESAYEASEQRPLPGHASCFESVSGKQLRDARPQNTTPEQWETLLRFAFTKYDGVSTRLSTCWLYAGVFKDGPKVYCPTLEEWEALARVELRIPKHAYRQPFDTTIIIIPDGAFGPISEAVGVPGFCAMRHWWKGEDNGLISGLTVGNKSIHYELDFRVSWLRDGNEELESRLKAINEASKQFAGNGNAFALQESEPEAMEKIKRACLNANLLLSQHAPRLIGKSNPAHAAKLAEKMRNRKLPAHVQAANAKQLHMMPTVYGFHQHITVCEHVREEDEESNATCTQPPKTPHWRRGHWLHQVCGVGRAERKLQFRPAKLVNEHLLAGPRNNTRVTMTTS